eukprot:CAMPEP_0204360562 /NCGR_PEP_ID=MMETSP0469-20131031/38145_1 /ASSEMBLY_ACC=CAM_ASM_000384 /TAXON_ID=2969 /ORGANISM="Oxyrrhis marina" /LENGTH=46 /DNA_ID= /DNA_START= /DNA_END= /DNA_ORIENTATION=
MESALRQGADCEWGNHAKFLLVPLFASVLGVAQWCSASSLLWGHQG